MQFDFLCLPLFVLHIIPESMPAVLTQADWGALRSQYENQVRVHTVAGVLEALQCGQTFQANLDIKFTAQYNQHCWVAHDATGRVIIDMKLLHSSVIASWPTALPVVGPGIEGHFWGLWGRPKLGVYVDGSSNLCPIMICTVDTIWSPVVSCFDASSRLACIDLYGGIGAMAKHLSIAGINVVLSIESESRVVAVAKRNTDHEVLLAAVEHPCTAQIAVGRGQFVVATPPCTPWSKAGAGQGFRTPVGRAMLDVIVFAR